MNQSKLFTPVKVGPLSLKNRIVMAPMTRGRAENPEHLAVPLMAEYYRQRADAGLIVTEGTWVNEEGIGYLNVPGIYTERHSAAWRPIVDAVHEAGGRIFNQLAHIGAVSHPDLLSGNLPLGPSAVNPEEKIFTPSGWKDSVVPREMTTHDIARTVADFATASAFAKDAGFDGVEIHASHLYLFPEFLSTYTNRRTDHYGGSVENRCRIVFDVLNAVLEVWGPGRIGIKIAPATGSGLLKPNQDTEPTYRHLAKELNAFNLAYLHVLGPEAAVEDTYAGVFRDIARYFRPLYQGTLMVGGGYSQMTAETIVQDQQADLVAFGTPFIANRDLVDRFRKDVPLTVASGEHFYGGGAQGYAEYPIYHSHNE